MKTGHRLDQSTVDITINDLYWEEADSLGISAKPVDAEIFNKCRIEVMTEAEFDERETIMADIHKDIKIKGQQGFHTCFDWTQTKWRKDYLIQQGFKVIKTSTILAVIKPHGRYEIKYIYWRNAATDASKMLQLCNYTYQPDTIHNAVGQYAVNARGDKTMNGTMLAYGSHDVYSPAILGKTEPRMYNPSGKLDTALNALVMQHVDNLSVWEQTMIPAYAAVRDHIAASNDPEQLHRITPRSSAFAMTTSINYVVDPHNDSGAACELIKFVNSNGPLPSGHEWLFAIGGAILELPTDAGEAIIICVKGEGVYHGTLPTSSVAPTHQHGNFGSALITKKQTIRGLQRQAERREKTASKYQSSELYFGNNRAVNNDLSWFECEFCGLRKPLTLSGYDAVVAHERTCPKRKRTAEQKMSNKMKCKELSSAVDKKQHKKRTPGEQVMVDACKELNIDHKGSIKEMYDGIKRFYKEEHSTPRKKGSKKHSLKHK